MGFSDVMKNTFPFISIAVSFGGPLGTMAAAGHRQSDRHGQRAGGDSGRDFERVAAAIGDPTQRAALIQTEHDFQLQMAELCYKSADELEATAAADRASARNREVQVRNNTPRHGFYLITGWILGDASLGDRPMASPTPLLS